MADEDYDDDLPAVHTARGGDREGVLPRVGSGLAVREGDRVTSKASEEAAARGEDVKIVFKLAKGDETSTFAIGQDVGFVKAWLAEKLGVDAGGLTFTVDGRPMIDPLSLRDYDSVVKAAGAGSPLSIVVAGA